MKTAASTRSGCSAAKISPRCAPIDNDTSAARSVPVASITARASAAKARSSYPAGGRSDRPFPRPSKVSTRQCRAK